eukprot:gnl/TRDRNA2_/TRDRNA2_196502_c0_seq1.p1 gnl/TRDRNA2_/TRDRNA2_196502_c0~~gnl/TRDRNA2_/TRDRNA2_196502_c0_seq1.p1  ORF type:complete len:392 (-),score=108.16 gnl/TRDRNA2_/TRDRNA2_196502_c0_seq1:53-1228(-)
MAPKAARGSGAQEGKAGKDGKGGGRGRSFQSDQTADLDDEGVRQRKGAAGKGGKKGKGSDAPWKESSYARTGDSGGFTDTWGSSSSDYYAMSQQGYGGYGGYGAAGYDGGMEAMAQYMGWQPMPPQLSRPPLWTEYRTEEGTPYYYNSRTGFTQWERPAELDAPKVPADMMGGASELEKRIERARAANAGPGGKGGGAGGDWDKSEQRRSHDEGGKDGGKNRGRRREGPGKGGGGGKAQADKDAGEFGPPGCNLFVFHLPDDWTDDDLHEYFAPHGTVVSAKVMKELGTGRSRGFGFVSYEDRVSAATAIKKMQGYKILGKRLKVEFKKGEDSGQDASEDLGGQEDTPGAKNKYPDDERLIGYLRAISAKNVQNKDGEGQEGGGDEAAPES